MRNNADDLILLSLPQQSGQGVAGDAAAVACLHCPWQATAATSTACCQQAQQTMLATPYGHTIIENFRALEGRVLPHDAACIKKALAHGIQQ